jgi:hypothetical protein
MVLMVGSGAAAMMIMHWATSPLTDAATSAHRVIKPIRSCGCSSGHAMAAEWHARSWEAAAS